METARGTWRVRVEREAYARSSSLADDVLLLGLLSLLSLVCVDDEELDVDDDMKLDNVTLLADVDFLTEGFPEEDETVSIFSLVTVDEDVQTVDTCLELIDEIGLGLESCFAAFALFDVNVSVDDDFNEVIDDAFDDVVEDDVTRLFLL